jgi:hypothetical protein
VSVQLYQTLVALPGDPPLPAWSFVHLEDTEARVQSWISGGYVRLVSGGGGTLPGGGGGLPPGGLTGQVLTKQSDADFDADWAVAEADAIFGAMPIDYSVWWDNAGGGSVFKARNQHTGLDEFSSPDIAEVYNRAAIKLTAAGLEWVHTIFGRTIYAAYPTSPQLAVLPAGSMNDGDHAYMFTSVNQAGFESPPSKPRFITTGGGSSQVLVTLPVQSAWPAGMNKLRVYRTKVNAPTIAAARAPDPAEWYLIAEITDPTQVSITDSMADSGLTTATLDDVWPTYSDGGRIAFQRPYGVVPGADGTLGTAPVTQSMQAYAGMFIEAPHRSMRFRATSAIRQHVGTLHGNATGGVMTNDMTSTQIQVTEDVGWTPPSLPFPIQVNATTSGDVGTAAETMLVTARSNVAGQVYLYTVQRGYTSIPTVHFGTDTKHVYTSIFGQGRVGAMLDMYLCDRTRVDGMSLDGGGYATVGLLHKRTKGTDTGGAKASSFFIYNELTGATGFQFCVGLLNDISGTANVFPFYNRVDCTSPSGGGVLLALTDARWGENNIVNGKPGLVMNGGSQQVMDGHIAASQGYNNLEVWGAHNNMRISRVYFDNVQVGQFAVYQRGQASGRLSTSYTLPVGTIVLDNGGTYGEQPRGAFATGGGTIRIGTQAVTYTADDPTTRTFTGCTGGTGTFAGGTRVAQALGTRGTTYQVNGCRINAGPQAPGDTQIRFDSPVDEAELLDNVSTGGTGQFFARLWGNNGLIDRNIFKAALTLLDPESDLGIIGINPIHGQQAVVPNWLGQGLDAAKPTSAQLAFLPIGARWVSTDLGIEYYSDGAAWHAIGAAVTGAAAGDLQGTYPSPALKVPRGASLPAAGSDGRLARTMANPMGLWIDDGTKWVPVGPVIVSRITDSATVTNDNTLTDDTVLQFPSVSSGDIWWVEAWLRWVAADNAGVLATAADIKAAFSGPTGWTGSWGVIGSAGQTQQGFNPTVLGSSPSALTALGSTMNLGSAPVEFGQALGAMIFGDGVNTGTIKFRWRQQAANTSFLTLKAGSFLKATLLSHT